MRAMDDLVMKSLVERLERLVRIRKRPCIMGVGAAAERRETLGTSQLYNYNTYLTLQLLALAAKGVWRLYALEITTWNGGMME